MQDEAVGLAQALRFVAIFLAASAVAAVVWAAPVVGYKVVRSFPHDPSAFTEGLFYRNGWLYESTGLEGRSSIRKVALETGAVVNERPIPAAYFGEGIVDWKDELIELTWRSQVGFVYSLGDFTPRREFHYPGEGWALTRDDRRLIMSDGTSELRFLDPETLQEVGRLRVTEAGRPVEALNELEYVRGEIYANVWRTDRIARIDPHTGHVIGWIDLAGLAREAGADGSPDSVLNGIAYDHVRDRLFVTGKLWPRLFEIKLVSPPRSRLRAARASGKTAPSGRSAAW